MGHPKTWDSFLTNQQATNHKKRADRASDQGVVLQRKDNLMLKNPFKSMPDKIKALKPSKEGQTKYWTASKCDDNLFEVTLLVSQRFWSCFVSYIDYVNEKHVSLWRNKKSIIIFPVL